MDHYIMPMQLISSKGVKGGTKHKIDENVLLVEVVANSLEAEVRK